MFVHVLEMNVSKKVEEIPYDPTKIAKNFARNLVGLKTGLESDVEINAYLQENGLPEFKILVQEIPEFDMMLTTIDNDYVFCNASVCPFKMTNHVYGMLGAPCWLRGKVYDDLLYNLTGVSLYDTLEPDDIEYV